MSAVPSLRRRSCYGRGAPTTIHPNNSFETQKKFRRKCRSLNLDTKAVLRAGCMKIRAAHTLSLGDILFLRTPVLPPLHSLFKVILSVIDSLDTGGALISKHPNLLGNETPFRRGEGQTTSEPECRYFGDGPLDIARLPLQIQRHLWAEMRRKLRFAGRALSLPSNGSCVLQSPSPIDSS